jgi:tRNA (guanine37-N1)-methyltransferase
VTATRALQIDIVTLFPEMLRGALEHSILARAIKAGHVNVALHDLRAWGMGTHRQVDDAPFGGGAGMVLRPEPVFAAIESILGRPAGDHRPDEAVILLAPAGKPHDQRSARRLAALSRLVLVCGRYEGVDDRVRTHACSESLSIGDFVLSGGEPAALCVVESVVRLLPGVLGNEESSGIESHEDGLLEGPHWTRPAVFRGLAVPEMLLSGHHAAIDRWRREQSLRTTARVRPDLVARARAEGLITNDEVRRLEREHGGQDNTDDEAARVASNATPATA